MTTRLPEVEEQVEIKEDTDVISKLVVYNDDVNSFDHVILTFMEVLGYEEIRSEQLAWNIHNTGRAVVKEGAFEKLIPYDTALKDNQLSSKIE